MLISLINGETEVVAHTTPRGVTPIFEIHAGEILFSIRNQMC